MSDYEASAYDTTIEQLEGDIERLRNGCEQALLLLERHRFSADPEAKVVRALLRAALTEEKA